MPKDAMSYLKIFVQQGQYVSTPAILNDQHMNIVKVLECYLLEYLK